MHAGDGTDARPGDAQIYYTSSPQLADDVNELAFLCGYETSLWGPYEGMYHVHINKEKDAIDKCSKRCITQNPITTSHGLARMLNEMTSCETVDKDECDAIRQRRDDFLDSYCEDDPNAWSEVMDDGDIISIDDQDPEVQDKLKTRKLDYVCGFACDGKLEGTTDKNRTVCANN